MLHDGGVFRVLGGLAQARGVHPPEVALLGVDSHGAVGADAGPAGIAVLLFGNLGKLLRGEVVFEVIDLLAGLGAVFWIFLIRGAPHVEGEVAVVFELQLFEREMPLVERVADDFGYLHGEPGKVEDFGLAALRRVYEPVFRALGGLVAVPEPVGILEPARPDRSGEDHLVYVFLGETLGLGVVGPGHVPVGLSARTGGAEECRKEAENCRKEESEFHMQVYLYSSKSGSASSDRVSWSIFSSRGQMYSTSSESTTRKSFRPRTTVSLRGRLLHTMLS